MKSTQQPKVVRRLPLSIYYQVDDMPISPEAMRVYVHLVRRTGQNTTCWPSYASIGEACFSVGRKMTAESRRRAAMRALQELVKFNIVQIQKRQNEKGEPLPNVYVLTEFTEWILPGGSDAGSLGSDGASLGSDGESPKEYQTEDPQTEDPKFSFTPPPTERAKEKPTLPSGGIEKSEKKGELSDTGKALDIVLRMTGLGTMEKPKGCVEALEFAESTATRVLRTYGLWPLVELKKGLQDENRMGSADPRSVFEACQKLYSARRRKIGGEVLGADRSRKVLPHEVRDEGIRRVYLR